MTSCLTDCTDVQFRETQAFCRNMPSVSLSLASSGSLLGFLFGRTEEHDMFLQKRQAFTEPQCVNNPGDHTPPNSMALVNEWTIPSNRHLLVKLVPTFADEGCRVVSATDPHGCVLGFIDRSYYYFLTVVPQLYSRGWVDPVPDSQLPRKSGSAGNWTQNSVSVARNSDQ
jgi:hypothetical protein